MRSTDPSPARAELLVWSVFILALLVTAAAWAMGAWKVVGAVALVAAIAFVMFLERAGKHPRRHCGFCGYDRQGLPPRQPCPECGIPGDRPGGPLHKAVGHRALPVWIWLPAVLGIPAIILAGGFFRQREFVEAGIVGLVALLVAAGWWAWSRGR